MGGIVSDPADLVAELLRQAAKMCSKGGISIEGFIEVAAEAFAFEEGDEIENLEIKISLSQRDPPN